MTVKPSIQSHMLNQLTSAEVIGEWLKPLDPWISAQDPGRREPAEFESPLPLYLVRGHHRPAALQLPGCDDLEMGFRASEKES